MPKFLKQLHNLLDWTMNGCSMKHYWNMTLLGWEAFKKIRDEKHLTSLTHATSTK